MKTITGNLILITDSTPTLPPRPVIARSVKPGDPWFIRLVLWLATCLAPLIPPWSPPVAWTINKARLSVLAIVGMALVEVLVQNRVEKILVGVMA
ncbi:MAG: hypothetical protein ACYS1A_15975 [Planctomycetota bacterium]|jgi:hypothetical protein